jgi:hypothetical protein
MTEPRKRRLVFVYTSEGGLGAFMVFPYLFDRQGEWIGWVNTDKQVYSVLGFYVGFLVEGPRILRKRTYSFDEPQLDPPAKPGRINVPPRAPLAPLMPELAFSEIDVLQDEPERLHTMDAGELREDLD